MTEQRLWPAPDATDDAEDLRGVIGEMLGTPVVSLDASPHAYRTSHAMQALGVRLTDGRRVRLLLKDLCAASDLAPSARPCFLEDPLREPAVYREILESRGLGTAHCHGVVADPRRRRVWLLLEHVRGVELWQIGEPEAWHETARWLARLHTTLAEVSHHRLLRYDRTLFEAWPARARAAAGSPWLDKLAAGYEPVVERLLALPTTVVHGEFYPSNILVERRGDGIRVCPVDWEMAGVGPALLDLAALTSGDWTEDERSDMVQAYNDALPEPLPVSRLADALACCRLHIALQWLGWRDGWSPPVEHAHDWLAEARTAAAHLGIG